MRKYYIIPKELAEEYIPEDQLCFNDIDAADWNERLDEVKKELWHLSKSRIEALKKKIEDPDYIPDDVDVINSISTLENMEWDDCAPVEDWTTIELFDYCVDMKLISEDEEFEDWADNRTDLYQMVRDDVDTR